METLSKINLFLVHFYLTIYTIGTGGTQTITAGTSEVTLSEISTVSAGSVNGGSTNNILSNFKLEVADVAAELTDVNAPNSGSYTTGDFDNFKLWYNSANDFGTASTIATIAAPDNNDPQAFTGFTQSIGIGNTGYFWITGDVSGSAVLGNTITMGSLGGGDITFSGSVNVTGTAAAGGEKTIALETDPSDAFQSQANGQWGNLATWQSFTGGNWINATSLPTTASSSITVKDSVSIPSGSVTADDVIVSSTGILQIVSGATFVVANGAAAFDVSVSGLLRNSGTLTLTGAAEVNSGGTFDHNIAAFAIPSITWNVGSTLKISGIATVTGGQNLTGIGAIYNLIYDCPSQSAHSSNANYTVLGGVAGVNIQGNFTVNSTGAGLLLLAAGGTSNIPVAGNYSQTGGYVAISRGGSGLRQLTVTGNVTLSGSSTLAIESTTGSNVYNLNIAGNLDIQTGATLTGTTGSRTVVFNGSSAQQFSNTGTFSGAVGIEINNLSGVTINNAVSVGGATTKLTAGTITHGGNLTVQTGSTITVVDGTFATLPTFAGTVSLTYANTVAKTVGSSNELPGTNSVVGLSTAGGSAEVTIDSDLAVTGAITVTGGDLKIAATRTVTWSGSVASSLASGKTFTVDGTLNRSHTGTFTVSGTLTYSATGKYVHAQAAGTIPAATWTAGSLCEVTLQTSSAPGGLGQAFADFNWNCQTQSQAMGLSNALNNVTGTLTIAGTNNQELRLASTTSSTYNFANINVSGANSAAKLILSSSSGVSTVNTTGNVTIGAAGTISFNTAASIMNVGGNWTNNGTFTAGSNGTVNFNGSSAQTFAASGTGNFYKLTVNNSSTGLDLSNSATVTNALTLTAGRVNSGVNSLIVTSTGSIARTSGYVNGFLQRTVVNGANSFPVGSASAYTPATVTMSGVSGAVDLTATAILGNPVASGSAINPAAKTDHYWNITKSGAGTFTSYSALFDFTNATNTGTTANYIVRKYDSGPGWTTPSSSVTGTTLTATGLTSFSDFEIGEFDCENPAITVNPAASQELCEGETATDISVTATGDFLTYQWYSNVTNANTGGVSVGASNGGQTDTYTPQTGTPGTTYYYCVVTGGCGSPQSSSTSEVIVNEAPAITAESLAGATYGQGFGGAAAISVTATGTGLTYQWYSNATASNTGGTLLSGEESNTLTPSTATIGILYYYCEVSGTCSPAVTSNVSGAIEIVASCTEPVFSTQPTDNQTECVGGTLTLGTVAASETPTYQWYSNATKSNIGGTSVGAVNGGQTDTYTPPSATPGTYYYYVIATNGACPTRSNAVEIEILAPPSISAQSTAGASYALNASATALTVTASGAGTLTYQWYSNATASNSGGTSVGAANGGQTNSFTPPTTSLGTTYYYCVVSGDCTPTATSAVSGAISIVQYSIGDYGSNSGGSWTSTATWRTWTGSGWSGSAPGVVPTTTSNVYILSGHTVTVPSSGTRTCANLTVDGTLTSSSITAVESPQYLSIYGSTITVNTGGFVGNSSTPTGDDADALGFQLYNTTGNNTKTFTGSGGSLYLSRVQYMNSGITIVVDRDMTITYHGGTNQGGHTAGIYPTSGTTDNSVLTINAGKTLTFAPWSCLTTTSSSNAIPTGVNMTVNVNGTLTLQDSPAPNGNNPAQNSFIYGGVGTGKLFTLNIGSTGIVNAPQFYPNGTTSGGAVGTGTDASVTVAAGGVFNVSKIIDLRKPTQTITGGGTFNLTGASQIRVGHANGLSATGAIQTSSSSFSSTADYSFEGTAAQVTGNGLPTTVNNFTVANAAGVTLQGNLTTNGLATVSSGSLTIAAGKRLTMAGAGTNAFGGNLVTLKSDLTGTATIGTIAGSLTGATNVEAERYVRQNTFRGWRMLAVPTKGSQTLNASWQEGATSYTDNPNPGFGTRITANTPSAVADGYDAQTFGNSLLSYTPGTSPAWVGVTSPTTSTAVATTSGWMLYVRGNRTVDTAQQITSPTETVLRTRGELYVGNETVSTVSGFNLVGNIYASEIDFTNLNRTSVSNKFYVWDPKLAGSYGLGAFQSFSSPDWLPTPGGGSYGNTLNTKIQSGMAFLVESIGAGSVGFTESAKSAGINGAANGFRPSAGFSYISTNLYAGSGAAASLADGNRTFFDEGFSNDVDVNDVLKASNFGEGIGMYRDGKLLQTERRKPVAENDYIEYRITGAKTMKYKLEFVPTSVTLNGIEAFLEDKYLNTVTPVPLNVTSSIEFNANASQVATFANRFKLVFRAAGTVPVRFTTVKATQQGTAMHVEWTVAAETGITKYEVEHSTNGTNFTKVGEQAAQANTGATVSYSWLDATPAAGINYYRVKSVNASGEVVYTTIVKVVNGQVISSIVLVSNPVRNNVINMQFNNQEKGNYVVKVMDSKGQQVVIDRVAHTGGNATVGINLPAVAKGMYQVEVQSPNTSRKSFKVVVE